MLRPFKRRANYGMLLGMAALLIARFVTDPLDVIVLGLPLWEIAMVALAIAAFGYGTWNYARSKGHRGAWGLGVPVGFALIAVLWFYAGEYRGPIKWAGVAATVVGLLVLAFLPDEYPWGEIKPFRKAARPPK